MRFELKAIGPGGGVEAIDFHASDEAAAVQALEGRGYTVLSVRQRQGFLGRAASRFPLVLFSQELRALLGAGLPLVESIDTLAEKERGFREYFHRRNNGKFDIRTYNLSRTPGAPLEQQVGNLLEDAALRGIFVSTSTGTFLTAAVLERYQKNGLKLIGYDMLEENITYMQKGYIDFLINQNPKRQAFLGVNHLVNHLILKKTAPPKELLPLEIISPENMHSYLTSGTH